LPDQVLDFVYDCVNYSEHGSRFFSHEGVVCQPSLTIIIKRCTAKGANPHIIILSSVPLWLLQYTWPYESNHYYPKQINGLIVIPSSWFICYCCVLLLVFSVVLLPFSNTYTWFLWLWFRYIIGLVSTFSFFLDDSVWFGAKLLFFIYLSSSDCMLACWPCKKSYQPFNLFFLLIQSIFFYL